MSRTLTIDDLFYLKTQFSLLEPSKNGTINIENIKEVYHLLFCLSSTWFPVGYVNFSFTSGQALMKNITNAMKESRIPDLLTSVLCQTIFLKYISFKLVLLMSCVAFVQQLNALQYRRMDFDEFCAAALSIHQLEALDRWEQHARYAYDLFEKDGNRPIVIEELASVCLICLRDEMPVHPHA